jgi:hypothetical protein
MTTLNPSIATGGCIPRCPPGPIDRSNPSNASTSMQGGKAVFENDSYRITAGDDNEVVIHNKITGETYRAWGDPHMMIDGQHAFDFWGTTTFVLDDGTKVTIETTPWGGNPNATVSSKVTITNGDYGVQITGVDTNTRGDLAIDEGRGWGRVVDWAVDDGNVLHENTFGSGFVAVDDQGRLRQVDQNYINQTDLLKGGALTEGHRDAFRLLGGLMAISFVGAFLGTLAALGMVFGDRPGRPPSDPRPRPIGPTPWDPTPITTQPARPPLLLALTLARWGA